MKLELYNRTLSAYSKGINIIGGKLSRSVSFCLVLILTIIIMPPAALSRSVPGPDTPDPLKNAWLQFHGSNLCQGVDAVFSFNDRGVEIWSLVEDEKSYRKFIQLLEPLKPAYRIEVYATYPQKEEKPDNRREPPPSLWQNYELRSYLGDPFARGMERADFEQRTQLYLSPPDEIIRQQLVLFAEQTLDWNRKMERYARDLPSLIRTAADPQLSSPLKSSAKEICLEHVRGIERYIGRLNSNLSRALPRSDANESGEEAKPVDGTLIERATRISEAVGKVSQRVHRFIHPENFTVSLDELREPSLLQSLKMLQKMDSELRKALETTL